MFIIAAVDRRDVLRVWSTDRKRPQVITRAGASEVAVTSDEVFWLAADGTPRVRFAR